LEQKDTHKSNITSSVQKEGGLKMALLAVPCKAAFCLDSKGSAILQKKSTAVLDALRKIRASESKNSDQKRLQKLDVRIEMLQDEAEHIET